MPDRLSNIEIAAQQVELVTGRLGSLSTLPCVGAQLFIRLLQGRFSPSALADLIESDPALATCILSLISRRGLPLPKTGFSLRRSLDELPVHEVRDAVLSVKVMQPFDPDDGDRHSIPFRKGLLLHSLAVACCAEQLAELTLPNIDSQLAYYAGLLHDIGKFALQETMPKGFARLVEEAESARECFCTIERKHLGTDHTVAGNHLAQKWRLPDAVTLAIWLHHSDVAAISQDMPEARIAAVVQLADSLARQLGIGQSGSFDSPKPPEAVAESLGIDIEQLQHIGRNLAATVEQKSKVLGLELPNAVADYCQAAHAAAAQFARQHTELSDENCQLQSASSHLNFAADFLLSLSSAASPVDIAENFAVRWQKFYQTGMVCLYLAPSAERSGRIAGLDAVLVENLSQSRIVALDAPDESPAIPKEIANEFAVLSAGDHIGWLSEQLDVEFDASRTKLVPLLSAGRAVGAIAFELH
jgi:putative nucleotidyltransferase with HDIG domain